MTPVDIGLSGVLTSLVLIGVAVALSIANRLGVERTILWSAARAAAQLFVVGIGLTLVFDSSASTGLALAWVALMVVVAAVTVRARAPEVPSVFWLALASTGTVAVAYLAIVFGLGIFPFEARAIIPLAGMNVGNAMAATVAVARRIVTEVGNRRPEIEARLALGLPSSAAAGPAWRDAMRTALLPQIENTKAVGLIALPGAMTGLILAGVPPRQAVLVQVAVMYLILGSVSTAVAVVAVGLRRRVFTADHRLVPLDRRAD